LFPTFIVIFATEKTITINTVEPGERMWTFGQTLALIIAIYPAWDALKLMKRTVTNIVNTLRVSAALLGYYQPFWFAEQVSFAQEDKAVHQQMVQDKKAEEEPLTGA
jgi:hypothetical protein